MSSSISQPTTTTTNETFTLSNVGNRTNSYATNASLEGGLGNVTIAPAGASESNKLIYVAAIGIVAGLILNRK